LAWARSFTVPGALVLIAVEAGFVAGACLVVPAGPRVARSLVFPAAMTLAEWGRFSWPFGGLPIGGVYLGQAGGPVLGVARLGGPLALTAMVYVGGVGVACLAEWGIGTVRALRHEGEIPTPTGYDSDTPSSTTGAPGRATTRPAMTGLVAAMVVVGLATAAQWAPDGGPPIATVSTAAVQGGGVRGFRKSQVSTAVVLGNQVAATRLMQRLDGGKAPQLVLWPEDVVSLDTRLGGSAEEAALSHLARSLHTTLVVGVTETISATAFRNEVVAWGPDGTLVSRYEKVHRVPFGEYVPYRSFFAHLGNLSAVPRDAIPGTGTGLLPTPAAPLGAMISFEVFYADRGRPSVRNGAQLLIVPTNTSSYAAAQVPTQEIAATEVQAVQQGRDVLQAAPTGYSAAVTNRGRLLARSTLGAQQVIFATLARRTGWTWYVRFGDVPIQVLGIAGLLAGWLLARRRSAYQGSATPGSTGHS
jgi:apolipoprotein N-acyltransferase